MISGTWMYPREDEAALRICRAPRESDQPRADSDRAQRWRLSLASLLFLTILLSDQLWLCVGAKVRDKSRGLANDPAALGGGTSANLSPRCDTFPFNNLTKPAAVALMTSCAGAPLDSACTKLHSLQRLWGALSPPSPSFWPPSAPTSSFFSFSSKRNFLKAYFRNFSLSFCDSYSISDLLLGMATPETLDCSLESLMGDFAVAAASSSSPSGPLEGEVCGSCIRAYQRLDQHAQEKYEEFDFVLDKFLQSDEYSVRSCVGDCKAVYKAWLCSEYFNVTQRQCRRRIPCKQYCLEVQTRCPFVLPDNDDLIYGGLPGFICTGLLENQLSNAEAQCCDVRWRTCNLAADEFNTTAKPKDSQSFYYYHNSRHRHQHHHHHHRHHHLHPYHHHHQPSLLPVSAGSRLGHSKLRLCVLVLVLLHTMTSFSTVQSNSGMSLEALPALDESTAREE